MPQRDEYEPTTERIASPTQEPEPAEPRTPEGSAEPRDRDREVTAPEAAGTRAAEPRQEAMASDADAAEVAEPGREAMAPDAPGTRVGEPRQEAVAPDSFGTRVGTGPDASGQAAEAPSEALLRPDEASAYRTRWDGIQASFVDEPRQAVTDADRLVAEVMQRIAERFANQKRRLEGQWSQGSDVSTEDLRAALQQYRSFFQALLRR